MHHQSGNSLLVRPTPVIGHPDNDESLSSWIYRLAIANGFSTYAQLFSNERVKVSSIAALDIAPERWDLVAHLHRMSLYPENQLETHTLRNEISALAGDPSAFKSRWILAGDTTMKIRAGGRYVVCVDCLASDAIPYWRRGWRLSTSTVCWRHKRMLLDACSSCGAPFVMSGTRATPLDQCSTCNKRLLSNEQFPTSPQEPSWRTPYSNAPSDFPVALSYSHLWWDGIRVLLNVFGRPKLAKKLQALSCPAPIKVVLAKVASEPHIDFDRQPINVRHELLNLAEWVTCQWPSRFVKSMENVGITWTEFSTCEIEMPYWLWSVCKVDLDRRSYQVTEGEVRAATTLLIKSGKGVSKIAVKRLLGVTEGRALDIAHPTKRHALTRAELVRVFRLLDGDLMSAPTGRDVQATMLRDACSIAVATWLRISFKAASGVNLTEGQKLMAAWHMAADDKSEWGIVAKLSLKWMTLYLGGSRARFERFNSPQTVLFISRFGLPTNGFGLAARFAELLRRCAIDDWERGVHLLVGGVDGLFRDTGL